MSCQFGVHFEQGVRAPGYNYLSTANNKLFCTDYFSYIIFTTFFIEWIAKLKLNALVCVGLAQGRNWISCKVTLRPALGIWVQMLFWGFAWAYRTFGLFVRNRMFEAFVNSEFLWDSRIHLGIWFEWLYQEFSKLCHDFIMTFSILDFQLILWIVMVPDAVPRECWASIV